MEASNPSPLWKVKGVV